jgi:hypothetical protein
MDETQARVTGAAEVEEERAAEYVPPRVVTYRGEEIAQELGPAQACSFVHSVVLC